MQDEERAVQTCTVRSFCHRQQVSACKSIFTLIFLFEKTQISLKILFVKILFLSCFFRLDDCCSINESQHSNLEKKRERVVVSKR